MSYQRPGIVCRKLVWKVIQLQLLGVKQRKGRRRGWRAALHDDKSLYSRINRLRESCRTTLMWLVAEDPFLYMPDLFCPSYSTAQYLNLGPHLDLQSSKMNVVLRQYRQAATRNASILVVGEMCLGSDYGDSHDCLGPRPSLHRRKVEWDIFPPKWYLQAQSRCGKHRILNKNTRIGA
jgi:hypothetical protein